MIDTSITLRRARPADAAEYARLMGDPAVFPNLMQLPLPSEEPWRTRLEAGLRPGLPRLAGPGAGP
ncbi:MAG: hypothetical protein KGI90_08780 [Burkholderiales bacterium]|nr:hypothetical protein [Burkholderiales bacterium]